MQQPTTLPEGTLDSQALVWELITPSQNPINISKMPVAVLFLDKRGCSDSENSKIDDNEPAYDANQSTINNNNNNNNNNKKKRKSSMKNKQATASKEKRSKVGYLLPIHHYWPNLFLVAQFQSTWPPPSVSPEHALPGEIVTCPN